MNFNSNFFWRRRVPWKEWSLSVDCGKKREVKQLKRVINDKADVIFLYYLFLFFHYFSFFPTRKMKKEKQRPTGTGSASLSLALLLLKKWKTMSRFLLLPIFGRQLGVSRFGLKKTLGVSRSCSFYHKLFFDNLIPSPAGLSIFYFKLYCYWDLSSILRKLEK